MKKLAAMIALALTTTVALPAMAQTGKAAKPAVAKAAKPKVQDMRFDPLEMQGTIGAPDTFMGTATGGAKFGHFKIVRTSFYDKLVRSTENL